MTEQEKSALVLAEYLKKRFEKRGEARGIEIGIEIGEARGQARERAAWLAWYKNMKDAKARGEPFDEPPPFLDGTG